MKKVFFTLLVVTGFVSVNAQNLSLGPIGSFNHSWITGSGASDNRDFNPSFKAGATITYSIHPHWALGADLLFANEGAKSTTTVANFETENKVNLNYIRVPLKAIYFFGDLGDKLRPKLYAGPSFGFLVGGKAKTETKNTTSGVTVKSEADSKDFYEGFDFGLTAGAGLNYRIARAIWLNFDVNYTNGFLDVTKNTTVNKSFNANRNLGVAVGVTFPIGTVESKK